MSEEYVFLRFRSGVRMAEGAKVHAASEDEARTKAARLFYEHGDEFRPWWPETFVLRTAENAATLRLADLPEARKERE